LGIITANTQKRHDRFIAPTCDKIKTEKPMKHCREMRTVLSGELVTCGG